MDRTGRIDDLASISPAKQEPQLSLNPHPEPDPTSYAGRTGIMSVLASTFPANQASPSVLRLKVISLPRLARRPSLSASIAPSPAIHLPSVLNPAWRLPWAS